MGVWPTGTCGTIIKDWQVKYKLDLSIPFFNVIPVSHKGEGYSSRPKW